MSATTPQIVRSLLRSLPGKITASPTTRFGCSNCHSRAYSAWSNEVSKRIRSPSTRNVVQFRQFSSSAVRGIPSERDKPPSDLFHMPPPSSHVEEKASNEPPHSHVEARTPSSERSTVPAWNESVEERIARITMPPPPPPPPPPKEPEKIEKPSDTIPDIPPSRPFPIEGPSELDRSAESPPAHPSEPQTEPAPSSAANALPSDNEKNRWGLSKKMQKHMDDFLAKAAIFSQQLNSYTGTDYSGIEALRQEIIEQERDVKRQHAAIAVSKEQYQQAYAAQSASQKEVVGLLERKHSWAAGDLERYMSLIRSEHLNEQAVQRAKDELASAERTLEEARSTLERKERKQYHEEQIWSDTIRRNSTWVTFGLMGLNIFLLLANLVLFEPWRRRRLVREVRVALEENALATNEKITAATSTARPAIEAVVDDVVEPAGEKMDKVEEVVAETVAEPVQGVDDGEAVGETALAAGEVLPEEAVNVVSETIPEAMSEAIPETISNVLPEATKRKEAQSWQERVEERWQYWKTVVQDLFSDREVNLKRVDVTTVALESAAAGMAVMGFLILLFNPR